MVVWFFCPSQASRNAGLFLCLEEIMTMKVSREEFLGVPTNEERREVAQRFRGIDHDSLKESLICAFLDAVGEPGYLNWVEIAHRLADLIEPVKTGFGSLSGVCPKCGGRTYVVCDDYDWWVITCDECGAVHGFNPDNYIPYGEIEREWKKAVNE